MEYFSFAVAAEDAEGHEMAIRLQRTIQDNISFILGMQQRIVGNIIDPDLDAFSLAGTGKTLAHGGDPSGCLQRALMTASVRSRAGDLLYKKVN